MAVHLSDQLQAITPNQYGRASKISTSEKYGKVTSFNITLNSSGAYETGVTPASVTYADGDVVNLITVKTSDKVRSIKLLDATGETGVTFDVGLYYGVTSQQNALSGTNNPASGTVAKIDAYATNDADAATSHPSAPVELAYLNRAPGAANQYVWEDAGLSENPGGTMVIALTLTGTTLTVAPDQIAFLIDIVNQ